MELRSSSIAIALLLLLLIIPSSSSHVEEIYSIDYRGPETHTYRPPPHESISPGIGPHSKVQRARNAFGNGEQAQGKRTKSVETRS